MEILEKTHQSLKLTVPFPVVYQLILHIKYIYEIMGLSIHEFNESNTTENNNNRNCLEIL
jgi:hypothetical protein